MRTPGLPWQSLAACLADPVNASGPALQARCIEEFKEEQKSFGVLARARKFLADRLSSAERSAIERGGDAGASVPRRLDFATSTFGGGRQDVEEETVAHFRRGGEVLTREGIEVVEETAKNYGAVGVVRRAKAPSMLINLIKKPKAAPVAYTRMVDPRSLRPIHLPDSKSKVDRMAKKLRKEGFNPEHPIEVVETDDAIYIRDGHHRAAGAIKARIKEVPIVARPPHSREEEEELFRDWANTLNEGDRPF